MKNLYWTQLGGIALIGVLAAASPGKAQSAPTGQGEAALARGATEGKTVYLVFYREWDAAAAAMAQAVKGHAEKNAAKASWTNVSIIAPTEKAVVDRFQTGRAPMPLLLAVHPNGAVTGAIVSKVSETELTRCMVSAKQAECVKALQQNKLVLLCLQTASQQGVPQGVRDFQADPHFANRTQVVTAQVNDSNEAGFFTDLKVDTQAQAPLTVFLAPPSVMVGKFSASVSKSDLATALATASKCCDDNNCKHHKK